MLGTSWTCIKCETINSDAESNCEVCGLERLYRRPEVEKLISDKEPVRGESSARQSPTPLAKNHATKTSSSKLFWFVAVMLGATVSIELFALHPHAHSSTPEIPGSVIPGASPESAHPADSSPAKTPGRIDPRKIAAATAVLTAKKINNKVSAKLSTLQIQKQRGVLTEESAVAARTEMKPLLQEALTNSEHAISLDSSNKDAWFQRVCTLYFWGKYPEADHYLRQATAKFPDCNDFDPLRPLIEKHLR